MGLPHKKVKAPTTNVEVKIGQIEDKNLKELALKRAYEYGVSRSHDPLELTIREAFAWQKTEEGDLFWSQVNLGNIVTLEPEQDNREPLTLKLSDVWNLNSKEQLLGPLKK